MTEPMSKVEVEDVLSSIRRLVSDDVRVLSQNAGKSAAPRLLLTDALRVYPVPEPVRPEPVGKARPPLLVLSNPIAPPAAAPARTDQGPSTPATPTHAAATVQRRLHLVTAADDAAEAPATGPVQGASEIARRLAEIEALLNAQDHSPFETEALPSPLGRGQMSWDVEDAAEAPFIDADLEPAPAVSASIHWAAPLGYPNAQETPDEIFATETPEADRPKAEAPPPPAPSSLSAADEEILRDLVREVMLEELRGATGERVTRNLRKIVRAEIARALAGRGMV